MTTQPQVDEFADAFASFASPGGGEQPAAEEPTPAAAVEEPAPAPATEEPAPAPAAEEPAPGGEPVPAGEPAPAASTSADELIERLSQVLQERPAEEPQPQPQAPAAEPEPQIYSPEEQEFLQNYESDWKDVSRGEELKRRSEYRQLVGFVFNQIASQFQPLIEAVDVLSNRAQLSDLRSRVDGYDTIRDEVIDWVGKQPQYLQAAYNNVIQSGTVDEVADLVDRFRRETGAAAAPANPAPAPKKTELSDDTRKAVEALAPVSTKRSAVPQAEDAGDFDAAFSRFAEVLKR